MVLSCRTAHRLEEHSPSDVQGASSGLLPARQVRLFESQYPELHGMNTVCWSSMSTPQRSPIDAGPEQVPVAPPAAGLQNDSAPEHDGEVGVQLSPRPA